MAAAIYSYYRTFNFGYFNCQDMDNSIPYVIRSHLLWDTVLTLPESFSTYLNDDSEFSIKFFSHNT